MCAISFDHEVGVDVELGDSIDSTQDLIDAALSVREREWVRTLDDGVASAAVLRCWVRKEAVAKGMGEGLRLPFPSIQTPCSLEVRGSRVTIERRHRERWFVWDIPMPPGCFAALAAPNRRTRIRVFEWPGGGDRGEITW